MIDRDLLDTVTHVVTHANCPDGVASAILLRDALIGARIDFHTHNTPAFEKLEARPGMLFCDLAPPHARIKEFVDAGAIVLDHHAKQREDVEAFGARGVFADLTTEPGVSGAMLAMGEVWMWSTSEGSTSWKRALDFATLAGIRDTWQTTDPRWNEARAQAEALRFYPWGFFERIENPFGDPGWKKLTELLAIGPVLVERVDAEAKAMVASGYGTVTTRGKNLMIVSGLNTSDAADLVGDQADLVVGFKYTAGEKASLQLSMRSRGDYDVGALCKTLDGGGHVHAAGARVPVTNGDLNPYEHITKIVNDWEHGL